MAGNEIAFARKYRPKTINEYIGERVKRTIFNRFKQGMTYPQVILFHGLSGGGKTSAARLLTKEYLCMDKKDGHACGVCEMCKYIEEEYIEKGEPVEMVQELDIASDSGKGSMDLYLENAMEPPLPGMGDYKILILDEVHMATNQAQNRLLKVTEEPPKHLVFILCTTNPEKLLGTLKGRCQLKVEVNRPSIEEMSNRLLYICQQEGIKTSKEALRMICKKTNRAPRDTINLLEEVAKNNGNSATLDDVARQIGSVNNDLYLDYIKSANESLDSVVIFNAKLKEKDIEARVFIKGFVRFVLDCINIRAGIGLEEYPAEYVKKVKALYKVYDDKDIDYLLSIVEHALKMAVDDTSSDLLLLTTALRIGKIGLLRGDLSEERERAEVENTRATKEYSEERKKQASESVKIRKTDASTKDLMSVFGKNLVDVNMDNANEKSKALQNVISSKAYEESEEEDKIVGAEGLMEKLGLGGMIKSAKDINKNNDL